MDNKYDVKPKSNSKYCYGNSNILKNKLYIQNDFELYDAERHIVAYELAGLSLNPVRGKFDFNHLKRIHFKLFNKLYEWAGETRTVPISKGDLFCLPQYIDNYAEKIFNNLKLENYYLDYDDKDKIANLVDFFGDLNALHPFREGNGRTQRVFIEYLAKINGINLNISEVSYKDMILASKRSLNTDNTLLYQMFCDCSEPLSKKEQLEYINLYCDEETLKHFQKEEPQTERYLR